MLMSISSGQASAAKVSWVPQAGQKVRVAPGLERNLAGAPSTTRKPAAGIENHATQGAPEVRRQMSQWQMV